MLELFTLKVAQNSFHFKVSYIINDQIWSLNKILKFYSLFISIKFDIDILKLLMLFCNLSFSFFDLNFVNGIDLKELESFF